MTLRRRSQETAKDKIHLCEEGYRRDQIWHVADGRLIYGNPFVHFNISMTQIAKSNRKQSCNFLTEVGNCFLLGDSAL